MKRIAIVELKKEDLSFSAGHFTIFSATEREDLHGHNYHLNVCLEVQLDQNGLSFDYRLYNNELKKLCDYLDRRFLLPSQSQFLKLEETDEMWIAHFNKEKIPFLKRDVRILPIANVTIEELSFWFLTKMLENQDQLKEHHVEAITVSVSNGPSQSGISKWRLN